MTSTDLQLYPVEPDQEYLKKWNSSFKNFFYITKNGKILRHTLYRKPNIFKPVVGVDKYIILLKEVESNHTYDFVKSCFPKKSRKELEAQRKYLKSYYCIIDENGDEIKEFDNLKTPYLVNNSCIYSIGNVHYNLKTGQCYGYSPTSMESDEFLFINVQFERNKEDKGVYKINKIDGSYIIFK